MRSVPRALELLLLGALTIPVAAQTPAPASTTDPQKADPLSFSKDATVIEDLQVKVRFENDGKAVYETSLRAKIQSESAVRSNGLIAFSYFASNESLDIKYVRVRKPDGTLVETPLESVQDLTSDVARSAPMYTDQHEKHVAVKGLSVGDTLEYRTVSTVIKPLAPGQFWFSHNFSKQILTLHEVLEINVPKDRAVRVLSPGNSPVVSEDGTRRIYTFQSSHLKKDPDPDKWEQALNGDPSPEIQVSSFDTWDEVAAWYGTLQKPSLQVTPELRAKAEELTRGKNTDTEKIRALYDYVSTKFRYISISLGQGRYAPHAASEVLANQFGDCKDKHTLLAALLQAVGIDAYPVLISSRMKIDPATPTPGLFDHVITAVPQKDSFLWLDTTPGVAPLALLSRPLRDKLALVISPGNKGLLIKTPADPPFPFFQHFTMTATLDSGGTLEGKARVEVRGDAELLLREAFRDTPQSGWKDLAQAYSIASGFSGTVDDVSAADSSDTSAPFWFTYSYHRPEYGDWPNHRIILPFPRMGLPELTKEVTDSAAAFPLGPVQDLTYEARLTLPKDLWPSLIPPVVEKRDFADYQSSYALEDRVLHGTRHLRLLQQEIPGAKRLQYVSLYKAVDEDERRWINLLGATAAPPSVPSSSSEAQHFYDEGGRSIQLGAPWAATTSLERAVKLDPSWVDAWLLLGEARLMASKPDAAVEAFRKAISLDPSNILGYERLSKCLLSLHRTEDAVQVWRDLLKVRSDDPEASENLAMLLADSGKYSEARPVLEKAIERNAEDPSLRFQLGRTYIQLGLEDQASEQFQKTMELRPDPEMRSAIAYALAEAKRHLPDALRYAEEAVQETEARTAAVGLDPSSMKEGYSLMGNLAAEWDTLGWVHFRLGNLNAAEKYAVAAWKLSQLPSIGDHLGQIYEKQGRKTQAAHTLGLALAALPTDGDPKLREKLISRVTAGGPQGSSWVSNHKEVEEMHTFSLKRIGEKDESAFFAVISTKGSDVAEVKFLNGPEELREAESAIATIKFSTVFPDATPTRIFRGGTLACNHSWKECRFMLFPYPPRILFPPKAH
jgi:tetratricopeptide (TPR) repeat protein/transglutaminase-like putative cysteine protease